MFLPVQVAWDLDCSIVLDEACAHVAVDRGKSADPSEADNVVLLY